jgi:hypothetical protein
MPKLSATRIASSEGKTTIARIVFKMRFLEKIVLCYPLHFDVTQMRLCIPSPFRV